MTVLFGVLVAVVLAAGIIIEMWLMGDSRKTKR